MPLRPLVVVETTARTLSIAFMGYLKLKLMMNFLLGRLHGASSGLRLLESLASNLVFCDDNLVAAVKLRQDNPGREDADDQDAKVDADADEVVGVALRLHAVRNC